MTVDLTEALSGQEGQIIITGEDGHGMCFHFVHPREFKERKNLKKKIQILIANFRLSGIS